MSTTQPNSECIVGQTNNSNSNNVISGIGWILGSVGILIGYMTYVNRVNPNLGVFDEKYLNKNKILFAIMVIFIAIAIWVFVNQGIHDESCINGKFEKTSKYVNLHKVVSTIGLVMFYIAWGLGVAGFFFLMAAS